MLGCVRCLSGSGYYGCNCRPSPACAVLRGCLNPPLLLYSRLVPLWTSLSSRASFKLRSFVEKRQRACRVVNAIEHVGSLLADGLVISCQLSLYLMVFRNMHAHLSLFSAKQLDVSFQRHAIPGNFRSAYEGELYLCYASGVWKDISVNGLRNFKVHSNCRRSRADLHNSQRQLKVSPFARHVLVLSLLPYFFLYKNLIVELKWVKKQLLARLITIYKRTQNSLFFRTAGVESTKPS